MIVTLDSGATIALGTTETAVTIGITDYSRRVTDDFGVTTVVRRGFSRRMSLRFALPFEEAGSVQARLAELRATPALWVADDRWRALSVRGLLKDFEIDLAVPPQSYCSMTIDGLAESDDQPDPGGDPAPEGMASTLRMVRPLPVTDAVLTASSVAEDIVPVWDGADSYADAARVRVGHRVYESLASGNVGHDPTASVGKWIDIGPTNRWAMFDASLGTATSAAAPIVVTLATGSADTIALLDVAGATARVQGQGYDRTLPVGAGTTIFTGLPGASVTVTITGPGTVSVGTLLVGQMVSLGVTGASPTAGITDYSRKDVDDFGAVTIVQRAWSKRMQASALIRSDAVDAVFDRIAGVRATPTLWIGDEGNDALTIYGFFKDASIKVGEGVSELSLSIEGLSTAAKVEPLAVSWDQITDPRGTKPADNADVTGDNTAKDTLAIGGRPAGGVLQAIDIVPPGLFGLAMLAQTTTEYVAARTTLDGAAIGTVVATVRTQAESAVEDLSLIGARNGDGTAFNLSMNSVFVDRTTTMAQRFQQVEAYADGRLSAKASELMTVIIDDRKAAASRLSTVEAVLLGGPESVAAKTAFLMSAVVTPAGDATAKAVLTLNAKGRVSGLAATNDGTTSTLDLEFDTTRFFKPDGTLLFRIGSVVDGEDPNAIYATNLVVDRLRAGSVEAKNMATGAAQAGSLHLVGSQITVPRNGLFVPVFNTSREKEEAGSVMMVRAMLNCAVADDLQCEIAFTLLLGDGSGPGGTTTIISPVNLVFDERNSLARVPLTPFAFFSSAEVRAWTGTVTVNVNIHNTEDQNLPLYIDQNSAFEVVEVKRAMIASSAYDRNLIIA